jgi:hypothetical protein
MAALLRRRNNHMGSLPLACLRGTFDFNPPGPRDKISNYGVCATDKNQAPSGGRSGKKRYGLVVFFTTAPRSGWFLFS